MLLRFILIAIAAYLLFRLIFDFIIPVYRTTRQVKKEFSKMQEKMDDYIKTQHSAGTNSSTNNNKEEKKEQPGEYIDFEEIK